MIETPTARRSLAAILLLGLFAGAPARLAAGGAPNRAFDDYWRAADAGEAAAAAEAIVESGADFDQVYERLWSGRPYPSEVATGRLDLVRQGSQGLRHHYRVLVPPNYDPARRYPVRFVLHGSISRPAWGKGGRWWPDYKPFEHPDRIAVFPSAWRESMWWQASQVENLSDILDRLKRAYNVDENRVYLFGISDGASGAYFQAFKNPTLWAAFLPFIGHPAVLGNTEHRIDGEIHVRNLANRALFVVNGGRDPVYPMKEIRAYLDHFRRAGAEVEFHPRLEAGHETRWWPVEQSKIEAFLDAHPRTALPDRLVWETERTDRYHRIHWLLITELGQVPGESAFEDYERPAGAAPGPVYPHTRPAGRIELERRGNRVEVRSRGVRRYKLLLSPEQFDFAQPITVVTNGRESFRGRLEKDLATLLEWAARDNDRTMLFGAELEIEVGAAVIPADS